MGHERFQKGELTTAFIDEEYPEGFEGAPLNKTRMHHLAAIGFVLKYQTLSRTAQDMALPMELSVQIDDVVMIVSKTATGVCIDGQNMEVAYNWMPSDMFFTGMVEGTEISLIVTPNVEGFVLTGQGRAVSVAVRSLFAQEMMGHMLEKIDTAGEKELICPMPGVVMSIELKEGQVVKNGEILAVIEAMKMENILRAEKDITVKKVLVATGDKLAADDVMVEFE